MANNLNEDVVLEILEQLWVLHDAGWDYEFRPDAFRRFYSNYSRISKIWTLPAQRYVYRHVELKWTTEYASFVAGLKNPRHGPFLSQSVRVLYLYISHSGMGISVQKLDKVLAFCPNLVELRLSTGPEINTLFLKSSQEARLRSYFLTVRPTLRALQLRIDGRCRKNQIVKQMGELVPFSTLDFLTFTSNAWDVRKPRLDPAEWDVRTTAYNSIQWPLETNAHTIPLRSVLSTSNDEDSTPGPIYPHTLRFNGTETYPGYEPHQYLQLLGSRLKRVMCQTVFENARWNKDCETIITTCPDLEQLILFDCHRHRMQKNNTPRLYVLEPRDWHATVEDEDESSEDEDRVRPSGGEAPVPRTRILGADDVVSSASHIVSFVEQVSNTWLKERNTIEFRKDPVFDSRWLQEALTGQTEPRDAEEMKNSYATCWSDTLIERHAQYTIALRRPSTLPILDTES